MIYLIIELRRDTDTDVDLSRELRIHMIYIHHIPLVHRVYRTRE